MMMNLYTIKDTVADAYGPVFTAKNNAVACRNFRALLAQDKANPYEYELYLVGSFDDDLGEIFFGHYEERLVNGKAHSYFIKEYIPVEVKSENE